MIKYKSGYKYQLVNDYTIHINKYVDHLPTVDHQYMAIDGFGKLVIFKGYAWDGPSGPTIDSLNFMRASLVHDVGYQLMAEGLVNQSTRQDWDKALRSIAIEDGMTKIRAAWVYRAVRMFGGSYGRTPRSVHSAP